MSASSLEIQSYLQTVSAHEMTNEKYDDFSKRLRKTNKEKKGTGFSGSLDFYLGLLSHTDKVLIPYMSIKQKEQLLRDLQVTYVLLLAQKDYENEHQKVENDKSYADNMDKCAQLIDYLNIELGNTKVAPDYGYGVDGQPVAYLGISLGKELATEMVELASGSTTKDIIKYAGELNSKRLYWVWGSSFIKTMLSLMSPNFFNTAQASEVIKTPDRFTGSLSWGLYYFRFALNLGLLLKHTIAGPWMSEEEKDSTWTARFATQWQQRKFTLLNDSLWATANLVCFFWLKGKGVLGTAGDALTLGLLLFDLSVAIWDYAEQATNYNSQISEFDAQLAQLDNEINNLAIKKNDATDPDDWEQIAKALRECELRKNALERMKKQCSKEWQLENVKLATNLAYAVGLVITFAILAMPFMPLAASTLATMAVVGAVLCFAITVLYNCVKNGIEIYKAQSAGKEASQECAAKIVELTKLLQSNPNLDDNEKRLVFLEIKQLQAQTEYQEQMVAYQTMHFFRALIMECFIPAVVMASLVFLPLGSGLAMLGGAFGLALLSNKWIESQFKPEDLAQLEPLDELEYQRFCLSLQQGNNQGHSNSFFPPALPTAAPEGHSDTDTDTDTDEHAPLLAPR